MDVRAPTDHGQGYVHRAPTFLVGTDDQQEIMESFQKRDQKFSEAYQKNKPLCFSARSFQMTHPLKLSMGHKDADATKVCPVLLGVCDGVSQLQDFGIDPSILPHELLDICEELAMEQLMPDLLHGQCQYRGPVSLLHEAFIKTESHGSTTVLLAALDNSSQIHGKLHPMVAVLSIGDCKLLTLRRADGPLGRFETVFHTDMQRIGENAQMPLQVTRIDERIDPCFDLSVAVEVIEKGSAVHCVSVFEGDLVIMGSDGVFDNLFLSEVLEICNRNLKPSLKEFSPTPPSLLRHVAQLIVEAAHGKTRRNGGSGEPCETPIGRGGKADDTSVVIGEVVEWTDEHREVWTEIQRSQQWQGLLCGVSQPLCTQGCDPVGEYERRVQIPMGHNGVFPNDVLPFNEDGYPQCVLL